MFGFSKNDDIRALNQRVGRFLNSIRFSDIEAEKQRSESRVRIATPCIAFPFKEALAPKSYAIGITKEVSLHGMSMFFEGELDLGDYILIFGEGDVRVMVKAVCMRSIRDWFGMHTVGFMFSKVLNEKSYPAIIHAINYLEAPRIAPTDATSTNASPMVPTH